MKILFHVHVHTQNFTQERMGVHSINVSRHDFNKHLMQHLSHHLRQQTPFSPHLLKSTYKGKKPRRNSNP